LSNAQGQTGPPGILALARWAGWTATSNVEVGLCQMKSTVGHSIFC